MTGKIKNRIKLVNDCYHLTHNLLYFSLLSNNVEIKICININLHIVHGCQIWFQILTLWRRNFTIKFYHTLYLKCE